MKLVHRGSLLWLLALSLACGATQTSTPPRSEGPRPPVARQVAHTHTEHGVERDDPYFWMRSDDRSDPEVLRYLRAENEYTQAVLAPTAALRETLFQEIVARIPGEDASVPFRQDGWWYAQRFVEGGEYGVHVRRRDAEGSAWETYLDENVEAAGHSYYATRGLEVSDDASTLAYGEDIVGRRIYTIRFRDLATGENLPDTIEGTDGSGVFAADGRTYFYVKKDLETLREAQVWRHVLGEGEDHLVFDETDEEFSVDVNRSRSRELVLIGSHQTVQNEYRSIDAAQPASEPILLIPRQEGHEYSLDHANGRFYIRTNDHAHDFRLVSAVPDAVADRAAWRDELPAREGILLQDFELFSGHLVASERREGIARLRVVPWANAGAANLATAHEVTFEEPAYVSEIGHNSEFDTAKLRFEYSSMTTPESIFDYDMATRERELKKQQEVVGDFDPARYVSERVLVPARDGEEVPVSIVRRRDLDTSRPQPLLLYGYGSYGYSIEPSFSSPRLSLLDRGVIFAIAHVRGGQEMGRHWYDDGKLMNKRHTFEDFIDCAEHLVNTHVTASDRLFAYGASAGGLLMGAVANMRPDLFAAIVADVPFVDVVTTMLDASIPLTTFEYDEWGNPSERAAFDYMMSYSPYDNVRAQAYPPMLVITGLHDSQVQYWEPAKWVARLRAVGTGDTPPVFLVDMDSGHGGPSGRFRRHRETATVYAFLLDRIP